MRKAASYARFSNPTLQDAGSIDDQQLVCQKIARRHDCIIVKEFRDDGISGDGSLHRDGWLELMQAAKRGDFSVVIVESLSRMSRDLADSAGFFKRLARLDIQLVDLSGVADHMRVGLTGIIDQQYLIQLGNNLRRKWDGCITNRDEIPGKPAYGHRLVAGQKMKREPDPETAHIVVRIFREYVAGTPLRDIAARLNSEGILSPSGNKWNHNTLITGGGNGKGLLGNPIYIGKLVWNQTRAAKNDMEKRVKKPGLPDDLLERDVPSLRLIDDDLWQRAQALRASRNRQKPGKTHQKTVMNHMLAGRLVCGVCNGKMTVVWSDGGGKKMVGCRNARDRAICANTKFYSLQDIEATVLHGIKHDLDVEALTRFTKGAHDQWAEEQKSRGVERLQVERAITRANEKIDRIVDAITDSDLEVKPLVEKMKALELERAGLATRLEQLKAQGTAAVLPEVITKFRQNIETMVDALMSTTISEDEAARYRVAFGNTFESVVVHQTGKRKPVEVTPYARLSAIMGIDIMPVMRSSKEVLRDHALTTLNSGTEGTLSAQLQNSQIILLGRWRQAA